MPPPEVNNFEVLYRQIPPGGEPLLFNDGEEFPLHWTNFKPNRNDTRGLSVIRSIYRSPMWSAYREQQPDIRFRLAQISVELLQRVCAECDIGQLTFDYHTDSVDDRFGEPTAHCSIEALKIDNYNSSKEFKIKIKNFANEIVKRINRGDILGPYDRAPIEGVDDPRPDGFPAATTV